MKNCEQDESKGDPKFTTTIRLGGKSASYWMSNIRQYWKWRGGCKVYKNPILEYDVGQMSAENGGKACEAQVIFSTRSGMVRHMD
jgi:hypothetical protein